MQLAQQQGNWELPHQRVKELRSQAASEATRNSHPDSIASRTRGQLGSGSGGGRLDQEGGAPSSGGSGTQRKREGHPAAAGGVHSASGRGPQHKNEGHPAAAGGAPSARGRGTQHKSNGHPAQAGGLPISLGDQQVYGDDILELGELLASGGSCKVLHGMLDGEAVAVKVYHRTAGAKEEMRQELSCYKELGKWLFARCCGLIS